MGWDGGLEETQSCVTCSKTGVKLHQVLCTPARFWAAGFMHERVSSGQLELGQLTESQVRFSRSTLPGGQSPGEALIRRRAAGLSGPGALWQVQVSVSASCKWWFSSPGCNCPAVCKGTQSTRPLPSWPLQPSRAVTLSWLSTAAFELMTY